MGNKTTGLMSIDFNYVYSYLKKNMSEERYKHSCQVSKVAENIARHYGISTDKAKLLGLIHDCAKDYSIIELRGLIKKYNIKMSVIEENIPGLWHAYVGAELARDIFNIKDQEMLNAIRYHSTASSKLGLLGKIIYVSDKIEPDRKTEKMDQARKLVWQDIDLAMLELLNQGIKILIYRNLIIHPETLHARNNIIYEKRTF